MTLPDPLVYTPPPQKAEFPLTMQLVSLAVPYMLYRPPPLVSAELPLMVLLVRVAVPPSLFRPPPPADELPLTLVFVSVVVPSAISHAAAETAIVSAHGAFVQRGRAVQVVQAAAARRVVPLTVSFR